MFASVAVLKLKDSILPETPVWYCRHPVSGALRLEHSTCVTLMSQRRVPVAPVDKEKVRVAVSVAWLPTSMYTDGERKREVDPLIPFSDIANFYSQSYLE